MEGKILQEILRKKGIRQKEVAELLGVSKQSISNMLNNTVSVKSTIVEKIAKEFNIDISEFFGKGSEELLRGEIEKLKKENESLKSQIKDKDESITRLIGIIEKRI